MLNKLWGRQRGGRGGAGGGSGDEPCPFQWRRREEMGQELSVKKSFEYFQA